MWTCYNQKSKIYLIILIIAVLGCDENKNKESGYYNTKHGFWKLDVSGLPYFKANLQKTPIPYYAFPHLSSTGHIAMLADQWGNINVLTTEGGTIALNPNTQRSKSALYPVIVNNGEKKSLVYSQLTTKNTFHYGIGYAKYFGQYNSENIILDVNQAFYTPPNYQRNIVGIFTFVNKGQENINTEILIRSDIVPMPDYSFYDVLKFDDSCGNGYAMFHTGHDALKSIFIVADSTFKGKTKENSLLLSCAINLEPGDTMMIKAAFGYGGEKDKRNAQQNIARLNQHEIGEQWAKRLEKVELNTPEKWMEEECVWTFSQLLSFVNYDYSVDEYFVTLGGYGYFKDPNHQRGHCSFASREVGETSMPLSYFDPYMANRSLKWMAKTQLPNGDIPNRHIYQPDFDLSKTKQHSDCDIWFLLGCGEYVKNTRDTTFLNEEVPYWKGKSETMWEHVKNSFAWVRDSIGTGKHGLILMRTGDWNDCINKLGKKGKGESVMNSGMAARAASVLAEIAHDKRDTTFARELEKFARGLRKSVSQCYDKEWFIRAYSDVGREVSSFEENRLYINAQSWAALGGCGTPEQRKNALLNAIEKCHTDIGMTLISRPYSCPQPNYLTDYSNPTGEGENAGIWPQTVYWMVWALAEEGLIDEAIAEWKSMSLRNHSMKFPDVPFGIYNGPDCYSSHYAGKREGWTQVQAWTRMIGTPMNPMVAWQAFAMKKINENQ